MTFFANNSISKRLPTFQLTPSLQKQSGRANQLLFENKHRKTCLDIFCHLFIRKCVEFLNSNIESLFSVYQEFTHLSFTFSDTNCQKDAKTMKCAWSLSTSKYFLAYVSIMKISLCLTKNSLKIRKKDKKTIGKILSFNGKVSKYIYDLTNVNNTNDLSAASKYLVSVVERKCSP